MRKTYAICLFAAACGEPPRITVEPLQVLSWVPNRGESCVAALAAEFEATVTFSDQLDVSSLTAETLLVRPEGGQGLAATVMANGPVATLRLRDDLAWSAVYELVGTAELSGVERGHLAQELVSPFMTRSAAGCL